MTWMNGKQRSPRRMLVLGAMFAFIVCPGRALLAEQGQWQDVYAKWQTFTVHDGLPDNRVRALRVFGNDLWVGTENGLALRQGDVWRTWSTGDGLPWPWITAIDVDEKTHDVWLGSWGGGLARLSGGRFDRFNQFNSGLAGDLVFDVAVKSGRVWAATNGGLSSFDIVHDSWDLHAERRADSLSAAITSLLVRDGAVLASAWCEGLRKLDPIQSKWTLFNRPARQGAFRNRSPIHAEDTTIGVAGAGRRLWRATQTDLYRCDGSGDWETRSIPEADPRRRFVHCVAASNEYEAWLGTDDGLVQLADWSSDTWLAYRRSSKGPRGFVTAWRDGAVLDSRALSTNLPDNRIRCIAFDDDGIWVGTLAGLARGTNKHGLESLTQSAGENEMAEVPANLTSMRSPSSPLVQNAPPTLAIASSAPPVTNSDPATVPAISIGVLAKATRSIALPGTGSAAQDRAGRVDIWGVQLAVGEMNTRGIRGRAPFELVISAPGFTRYGWGLPEDDVPFLAIQRKCAGIVGSIGPNDRLGSAVVAHTEIPLVNSAATPPSIDELTNPWIFRCRAHDSRQIHALLDYLFNSLHKTRIAVLRTGDPSSEMHLNQSTAYARIRGQTPVVDRIVDPDDDELARCFEDLRRESADAVLTWCDERKSATILRRLREAGLDLVFVGADEIVCEEFIAQIGDGVGAVLAPYPCGHRGDGRARAHFSEQYAQTWPKGATSPDPFLSFDATCHLLEAAELTGPDRVSLQGTLRRMSVPTLAHLHDGRWESCSLPDAEP